jgi:ABC-type multidrug transport system ATPase subunit
LLGNTRLLLLEEPFSHLAQPYKSNVLNYIKHQKNATVIIASQEDDELSNICNKVITL